MAKTILLPTILAFDDMLAKWFANLPRLVDAFLECSDSFPLFYYFNDLILNYYS